MEEADRNLIPANNRDHGSGTPWDRIFASGLVLLALHLVNQSETQRVETTIIATTCAVAYVVKCHTHA